MFFPMSNGPRRSVCASLPAQTLLCYIIIQSTFTSLLLIRALQVQELASTLKSNYQPNNQINGHHHHHHQQQHRGRSLAFVGGDLSDLASSSIEPNGDKTGPATSAAAQLSSQPMMVANARVTLQVTTLQPTDNTKATISATPTTTKAKLADTQSAPTTTTEPTSISSALDMIKEQARVVRGKPLHLRFTAQSQQQRHMIRNEAHLQIAPNLDSQAENKAESGDQSKNILMHHSDETSSIKDLESNETKVAGQRKARDDLLASVDVSIINSDADISEWLYGSDLDISSHKSANLSTLQAAGADSSDGQLATARGDQQRAQPIRFKIAPASHTANGITVPPLWRVHDVQAENYTMRRVVDEANTFAIRLLHQSNREKLGNQNLVQPPFAIYKSLALLSSGAQGETAKELDRVLLGTQAHFDSQKLSHEPDRRRLLTSLADVLQQLHHSAANHRQSNFHYNNNQQYLAADSISVREPTDSSVTQRPIAGALAPNLSIASDDQDNSRFTSETNNNQDDLQYFILANNLLFSPRAHEISHEFKSTLQTYHNETSLTRVETGSSEAIQVVNSWIRRATQGVIPAIMNKRDTFDEYNVMTLMATTWLKQSWQDIFYRVSSSLRSNIRLKGQGRALNFDRHQSNANNALANNNNINTNSITNNNNNNFNGQISSPFYSILRPGNLMEFVDDKRESHFVEYIVSRPTANIQHYRTNVNGFSFELVSVPFSSSSHRFIALIPLSSPPANISTSQQITDSIQKILMEPLAVEDPIDPIILPLSNNTNRLSNINQQHSQHQPLPLYPTSQHNQAPKDPANDTDASLLTKFLTSLAEQPNKSLRHIWNLLAPELITRQVIKNIRSSIPQPEQPIQSRASDLQQETSVSGEPIGDIALQMKSLAPLVQLSIPIIRSDVDSSMVAALNHIGLVNVFDPSQANFIGVNGHPFNYNELYLSNVLVKTTFNLDENGVNHDRTIKSLEPLRVHPNRRQHDSNKLKLTRIKLIESSRRIDEIKLDKPFIWLTVDIKTRLILMSGVVRNPSNLV